MNYKMSTVYYKLAAELARSHVIIITIFMYPVIARDARNEGIRLEFVVNYEIYNLVNALVTVSVILDKARVWTESAPNVIFKIHFSMLFAKKNALARQKHTGS